VQGPNNTHIYVNISLMPIQYTSVRKHDNYLTYGKHILLRTQPRLFGLNSKPVNTNMQPMVSFNDHISFHK